LPAVGDFCQGPARPDQGAVDGSGQARAGKHGKMPSPEGAKVTFRQGTEKATFGRHTVMSVALSWLLV